MLVLVLIGLPGTAVAQQRSRAALPESAVGTVGKRQTEADVQPRVNPTGRIESRLATRIEARVRSRIERQDGTQTDAATSVRQASARVTTPQP